MVGSSGTYFIDVLAKDVDFDVLRDVLEFVDIRTGDSFNSPSVEIDRATGKLMYMPSPYYDGLDEFAYTIRNRQGLFSQGIVRVVRGR